MAMTSRDLRVAVHDAATSWRDLIRLSRPASWMWTGLAFFVGAFDAERGLGAAVILGALFFLGPFNLLRHGSAVVVGPDGRLVAGGLPTALAIAASNVPFVLVLAFMGGFAGTAALLVTIGLAIGPSLPPVRARLWPEAGPLVDAVVLVMVGVSGLAIGSGGGGSVGGPSWGLVVAFGLWTAATIALAAIARLDQGVRWRVGPRAVAGLALGANVVAVVIVAGHGPLGLLAAAGVALYLALPAMVVLAPGPRRALAERPSLDLMVGTWLTVLLLSHWGVLSFAPWEIAIVVPITLTGYVLWSILATRLVTRRRRGPGDPQSAAVPSVTIVVPCSGGDDDLAACLAAIRSQTYADTTILVVVQRAANASAETAAAWLGSDAVLVAPPHPPGWGVRDWACQVGAAGAGTDLILFVDTTTILVPIATRILVEQQQITRADLLTGLTRFATPTVGEQAASGFPLVLFGLFPIWWSALIGGRPPWLAFASGSLLMVRREPYLAAVGLAGPSAGLPAATGPGGRAALRVARAFAREGLVVRAVHAADLGAARHHRDITSEHAGWRRLVVGPARGGLAAAIGLIGLEVAAFVVPLVLPVVALATGQPAGLVAASSIPLGLLLVARIALVVTQRLNPVTIIWHPVAIALTLIGQVAGIVDRVRGTAPLQPERPPDDGRLVPSSG